MKRLGIMLALACGLTLRTVHADDWDHALQGGLIGAAVGAIVAHNSDLTTEFAVPAFAGLGVLAGLSANNGWYGNDRDDGYDGYDRYGYNRGYGYRDPYRYNRYDAFPYDYRPTYYRPHHSKAPKVRKPTPEQLAAPRDLTPGVQLVTVPISLPSGMAVNLRLIKLADGYVGPQGERYAELPSTETLAARYLPKP